MSVYCSYTLLIFKIVWKAISIRDKKEEKLYIILKLYNNNRWFYLTNNIILKINVQNYKIMFVFVVSHKQYNDNIDCYMVCAKITSEFD